MQSQKLALLSLRGRATLFYLRQINKRYQQRFGQNEACPLVLKKTNFEKLEGLLSDHDSHLRETLIFQKESLTGAEKIILPSITLHEALDRQSEIEVKASSIVHPIRLTIDKLLNAKQQKVMLISSQYGLESSYLRSFFTKADIEMITPTDEQQVLIDGYRKKIETFSEAKTESAQFFDLLTNYTHDYTVVLACAELSLSLSSLTNNVYDMARIQMDSAMTVFD